MRVCRFAPPPCLVTLDDKPSWHNRAGRVDRSACFVVSASKLWRRIPESHWQHRTASTKPALRDGGAAAACEANRRVLPKGLCDRHATLTLWARDLWLMHRWEPPYPLAGDFRTAKANALQAHIPRSKTPQIIQATRDLDVLGKGPINPNRGVGFNLYKQLGLDCLWKTTLRIERIVQHDKLKQHFLVCPACGEDRRIEAAGSQPADALVGSSAGCEPAASGTLPGRVTKLYLPLCTPQEYDDAQLARLWLQSHTHPNRPWPPDALRLIERYGELFEGRSLRCRACLGIRYGEAKAKHRD
jgi:hypothetical protein